MPSPIVFIHVNDQPFLRYSFEQARRSNPHSDIYLIGDESNCHYRSVKHVLITDFYTRSDLFKDLSDMYADLQKDGKPGGVCDMTIFDHYRRAHPGKTAELTDIVNDSVNDHNINMADGFELRDGLKEIVWVDNKPFGRHLETMRLLRFNILHFQGNAKAMMPHFLR